MIVDIPKEYKDKFCIFLGYKIDLSKRTLIPRTETAYWVKKSINDIKKNNKEIEALDIFSGSGCIGIAILKELPLLCKHLDFLDIDKKAIDQIKINTDINNIDKKRYNIYKSSFFDNIPEKKYDVIFSNPPYVSKERIHEVGKSVLKYEPHEALFSEKDGLGHIEIFLKQSKMFLKKEGVIFLEFDHQQKGRIEKILKNQSYRTFEFYKDQFDKYRFAKIIK